MIPGRSAAAAPAPGRLRLWRARVFAATWLCYGGLYFCRKPFSIVKSDLGRTLGFSAQQLAYIYSAYLIAYTAGQFGSSALGPKLGSRVMLLAGMAISIGTAVLFGFTDQFAWFAVLMAVNGLAQATGWSNCVGCMANWFRRGERGTVMGFWATCFQFGGVAANALSAWVLAHYGFRQAFLAGAMVLLVVWIFFFFNQANRPEDKGLPPVEEPGTEPPAAAASGGAAPARIAWSRQTWITVLLVGGAYFGMKFIRYALWSWAPFVLSRNFGLKGDDAGYVSTLFDLSGILGVVFLGWVSDHLFAGRRAIAAFLMILGLVAATLALFTVGSSSVTAFAVSIALVGFTLFGPDALMAGAGAMDIGSKGGAIRAAGIINGFGSAGSVFQELVIGRVYGNSGGAIGPILGTLLGSALLAAACLGAIVVRNRRGRSDV